MSSLGKIREALYSKVLSYADRSENDKMYLSIMFFHRLGYRLNWRHPSTFNEIIQWKKLYDHNPLFTEYADKYLVRQHIKEIIGEEYLIPLIKVYRNADEIDFSELPNSFVLKCNHGAGYNVICTNKETLNLKETVTKLNNWIATPFYKYKREYHYKNIQPLILCEEYMRDYDSDELKDYKFFCINGKVEFIQVDYDRSRNHTRNIYNRNWELLDVRISFPNNLCVPQDMPSSIPKMIQIAEKLADNFDMVRVDLYLINKKIYFGEMTFTPGAGFSRYEPKCFEKKLGSLLTINKGGNKK